VVAISALWAPLFRNAGQKAYAMHIRVTCPTLPKDCRILVQETDLEVAKLFTSQP